MHTSVSMGQNSTGACGSGDFADRAIAKPIDFLRNTYVLTVACGISHTAILTENGVLTFGENKLGQARHFFDYLK